MTVGLPIERLSAFLLVLVSPTAISTPHLPVSNRTDQLVLQSPTPVPSLSARTVEELREQLARLRSA